MSYQKMPESLSAEGNYVNALKMAITLGSEESGLRQKHYIVLSLKDLSVLAI